MSRDPITERLMRLETRIDDVSRALGSQAQILNAVRSSHDHALGMLSDAIHHDETLDLPALLASLEYDPNRPD